MNPTPLSLPFDIGVTLDPGETVMRVIYKHPFDLVPTLALAIILQLFAIGLGYAISHFPEVIPFSTSIILAMMVITSLLAALILLIGIYVYRHNLLIFTTVHLIYVEQVGLFGRRVSQLNFRNVEDVSGHKAGIFQTIFDYGAVTVQSAGEQEKFIFTNAPHPSQIADAALLQHEYCMRHTPGGGE